MHPPVAKPAQPTDRGAEKVTSKGKGAAVVLGMARDMSSWMPGSEKVTTLPAGDEAFWARTREGRRRGMRGRGENFIVNG